MLISGLVEPLRLGLEIALVILDCSPEGFRPPNPHSVVDFIGYSFFRYSLPLYGT